MVNEDNDAIGRYYERVRLEGEAARKRWLDAKANGAPYGEIQRLYDKYLQASNTGD